MGDFQMLTCNASELSVVKITSLQPGDLFAYAGSGGSFIAVAVENDERQYFSWMRLTGDHPFFMEDLGQGSLAYAQGHKVLNLALRWDQLQVQVDPTSISRAADIPTGGLVVGQDAQIVTAFRNSSDDDIQERFGVSLRNLERQPMSASSAYACTSWRMVYVASGLPPEVIAEFSRTRTATVETLRI